MFVRVLKQKRGEKVYRHVQIVESFRDPAKGNAPRTRLLAHLGTVEGLGEATIDQLIRGLRRAKGEDVVADGGTPSFSCGRDFGHVHVVGSVWDRLGFKEALVRAGINGETTFSPETMIRLLVVNRLCEPMSKWALLDWLDGVHYGFGAKPEYHHLLRAMDRLIEIKAKAEPLIAKALLPPEDSLDLVFYDITSTYFEGDRSLLEDDVRCHGYSRDGRFDKRQVVIGMVVTKDGFPVCHHVFPGDTADKTTVTEVVADLKARFSLSRVLFVGDRGMLSDGNLEFLLDQEFGFIVAHPLRHSRHAAEVIGPMYRRFDRKSGKEQFFEDVREKFRFVVAFSPEIAKANRDGRVRRLQKTDAWIEEQIAKLCFPGTRGRKPTAQGTYDRIRDYLRDHGLTRFYDVTQRDGQVVVGKDRKALLWESKIDGVLLVETTDAKLSPKEVIGRYKELCEIERGWRALKSTLLLRPVHHWTQERIRAHVFVCVLALQVERWMRKKLKGLRLHDGQEGVSVPKALDLLARIKVGEVEVGEKKFLLPSRPTADQRAILARLNVPAVPSELQQTNL